MVNQPNPMAAHWLE